LLHASLQCRAHSRPLSGAAAPAASAALDVSHSLKLQAAAGDGGHGGCYALALESAAPLFAVGLACSRELLLLDAPGNVAIVSRCMGGRKLRLDGMVSGLGVVNAPGEGWPASQQDHCGLPFLQ
jgi:hypothetical protein